ncbi:MAG: futalosine hydrolase [Bacteroidales bacterium]|jgi:futalosine hydrolase|nr:futalosine hydrolase [Bacteroidales bacterium]
MIRRILYTTSTSIEAESLMKIAGLEASQTKNRYRYGQMNIDLLITGVGTVATTWRISKWLSQNSHPDIAINAGIAGSFNPLIKIGDAVMPVSDCFADAGIEDGNRFFTLREASIISDSDFPFQGDFIHCNNLFCKKLAQTVKPVNAITVNTATGSTITKEKLTARFNPDIETMEGAAFFYVSSLEKIPFIAIRAVSNIVEQRDKAKWNIPLALENMTAKLTEILEILSQL